MSGQRDEKKLHPHEIVSLIVEAVQHLRKHEGNFLSAVMLLEQAVVEIHRDLKTLG